jgi:hypothetical protein
MSSINPTPDTKSLVRVRERPERRSSNRRFHWDLVLDCDLHYLETLRFCPTHIEDYKTRQNGFIDCAKCGHVCQVEKGEVLPLAHVPIDQNSLSLIQKHLKSMPPGALAQSQDYAELELIS